VAAHHRVRRLRRRLRPNLLAAALNLGLGTRLPGWGRPRLISPKPRRRRQTPIHCNGTGYFICIAPRICD
jgi:hypothetical protein